MRKYMILRSWLAVSSSVAVAAAVACGGGATPAGAPPTQGSLALPPSAIPSGSAVPIPSASGSTAPLSAFVGPMKPIAASTLTADVRAIGIALDSPPPLGKLEPDKLRKVMKLFNKALGAKCADCHADDVAAPTPQKKVAEKMWNEFVVKLSMRDGSPVFCDTCHQGRMRELDHTDKKLVSQWMDDNFVAKLERKDKKEHGCETCHGDPPEYKLIELWRK